jgi:hypothetical protein
MRRWIVILGLAAVFGSWLLSACDQRITAPPIQDPSRRELDEIQGQPKGK